MIHVKRLGMQDVSRESGGVRAVSPLHLLQYMRPRPHCRLIGDRAEVDLCFRINSQKIHKDIVYAPVKLRLQWVGARTQARTLARLTV
jgi:hypothetical protein